jgi:hypothetical protein
MEFMRSTKATIFITSGWLPICAAAWLRTWVTNMDGLATLHPRLMFLNKERWGQHLITA